MKVEFSRFPALEGAQLSSIRWTLERAYGLFSLGCGISWHWHDYVT